MGISYGIISAVGFSILSVIYSSTQPNIVVLGRLPGTETYKNARSFTQVLLLNELGQTLLKALLVEGIAVMRVDGDLYFANITSIKSLLWEIASSDILLKAIVIDGNGVNHVDSTAVAALSDLLDDLHQRKKVVFVLAGFHGYIIKALTHAGFIARINKVTGIQCGTFPLCTLK